MTCRTGRNRLIEEGSGRVLADDLEIADTPWQRMKGLLGRDRLDEGRGLLIEACWSVHTCFMRFPIDVIYLDREGLVRKIVHRMPPWRVSSCLGASRTVELPAGAAASAEVQPGARLVVCEDA